MMLLLIILTPLVASGLSFFVRKNSTVFLNTVAVLSASIELIAVMNIVFSVVKNGEYVLASYLAVNSIGAILIMIIAIVNFSASIYSVSYLKVEVRKEIIGISRVREYFSLLHLFVLAMFFSVITTNPILMWIAIEATTLSTVFLISFYNKPSATEATWKYMIINSLGLLLGFFGTVIFLYPSLRSGHLGLVNWQTISAGAGNFDPFVVKMAFIFVLIGYGTKVGFVPMHTWRPDAYSKAPIPIVALLSGSLLNVAFLAILRFKMVVDLAVGKDFSQNLFIFFGIISIVIASFHMFGQKNYKRLLAYSSIEHAGILALGFGFGGLAIFATLLHMIYHALVKSILFLSAGNVFLKYSSTKISKIKGMLEVLPVTGVLFMIGFLAIVGVPPFGTFLTEFTIFSVGIKTHPIVVIIALMALILVFVSFLRHISGMLFNEKEEGISIGESGAWTTLPILFLVVIFIFLSFYLPQFMTILLNKAALF